MFGPAPATQRQAARLPSGIAVDYVKVYFGREERNLPSFVSGIARHDRGGRGIFGGLPQCVRVLEPPWRCLGHSLGGRLLQLDLVILVTSMSEALPARIDQ